MDQKISSAYYLANEKFRRWVFQPDESLNRYWQNWQQMHPETSQAINEARLFLTSANFKEYAIDEEEKRIMWQNVNQRMESPEKIGRFRLFLLNWDYYSKIAATVLIFMLTSYIIYDIATEQQVQPQVVIQNVVKTTNWGERLTFQLPDGTRVKLNAGSTLTYPEQFIDEQRKIILSGEAYFNVAKDSLKPFRVLSGSIVTEALGTEFYVSNYSGHDSTVVALTEGKVKISSDQNELIIAPGQSVSYQSNTRQLKSYDYIDQQLTSWTDNTLIFVNADWPEIENKLERWYGVEIKNSNTQNKWDYSAKFKSYSLEDVLKSICYAKNLRFEINGDRVIIR